jgi:hypothetical protein
LAMYAEFLAGSLGDVEEAKKVLESCVQCGGRGQVYFSLGQVQTGMDAVQSFRAGIEQLEHDPQNNEIIASAYCRICEVFMTDLCFEENAEQICVTCATKALLGERLDLATENHRGQGRNSESICHLARFGRR